MASFNCFKPHTISDTTSHKPLNGSSGDSADNLNATDVDYDDWYSDKSGSKFRNLRSNSPRSESNVMIRALKTASVSDRNRSSSSRVQGSSHLSPMLSCMKGNSHKIGRLDEALDIRYDSVDTMDFHSQTSGSSSLSCIVRSHSDSTCLAMKAGKPMDGSGVIAPAMTGESYPSGSLGSNFCSPFHLSSGFGCLPTSPFVNFEGYYRSTPIGAFMGIITPSSYGTPTIDFGYRGMTHPSPKMSSYSPVFQCYRPYMDLFNRQQQQLRPWSIEAGSGGPLAHVFGPQQDLENTYPISSVAASPVPSQTAMYGCQNQPPFQPGDERAPAAPVPARRQLNGFHSHHHHHLPSNAISQRLRSPPPPSHGSFQQQRQRQVMQVPSGTGTAFKKPKNATQAPPPYESLQLLSNNPSNQIAGVSRGVGVVSPASTNMSPSHNLGRSQSAMGHKSFLPQNDSVTTASQRVYSVKRCASNQRPEAVSPVCQLPEFVNLPPHGLRLSPKQIRQQKEDCERIWQTNHRLKSENADMENRLATKERELRSCHRRSEELSTKLEVIRRWCEWLTQTPGSQRTPRPNQIPYFEAHEDDARWKRGCDELGQLDQKIVALRAQRRLHPVVTRSSIAKSSLVVNSSQCAQFPPSDLPPGPSNDRFDRHSSASNSKPLTTTPVPSPRLNRPASAPIDKEAHRISATTPQQASPRPYLPPPSPSLGQHKGPRFASRKEITAAYLTPRHWRNSEHTNAYKRSASENLQTQLALAHQQTQLQSVEAVLPEAKRLSIAEPPTSVPVEASSYSDEEAEEKGRHSSSSSSTTVTLETAKEVGEDENEASVTRPEALSNREGQDDADGKKPILRRRTRSEVEGGEETVNGASSKASTGVRFHPLALLLDAALEGDLELVKKAAQEVSDVSEANDEGITALHNAVCAGRVAVAEFLVEAGADVNAGDTDGWTPLHCAASCANARLARLLVRHGAALAARTLSDGETALDKCTDSEPTPPRPSADDDPTCCDRREDEDDCERFLAAEHELLGVADGGRVYALFPRGLEAAGPGSPDAHIEPDELPIRPNEELRIIDRAPSGETEWMLAEKVHGSGSGDEGALQRGLVPRAFVSRFPVVRVPPASLPVPLIPQSAIKHSDNGNGSRRGAFLSASPIDEVEEESDEESTAPELQMIEGDEMKEAESERVSMKGNTVAGRNHTDSDASSTASSDDQSCFNTPKHNQ